MTASARRGGLINLFAGLAELGTAKLGERAERRNDLQADISHNSSCFFSVKINLGYAHAR
ncbi:MAG: hypothetical protein IJQ63_10960 [Synergistaceae bacterium]|nr:hypothetical protein [Synergistaceae bacterium]